MRLPILGAGLHQKGFSHLILPIVAVVGVAIVGSLLIHGSKADSTSYSGTCTTTSMSTSTKLTTTKYKNCLFQAQELMDAVQYQNYKSYRTAVKHVADAFASGNEYYITMNDIYSTATAYAIKGLPGNASKSGSLTNSTTNGIWQILCSDAQAAGLATGGVAANKYLTFNKTIAGEYTKYTNASTFKATCGSVPSSSGTGTGSDTGGGTTGSGTSSISCNYQTDTWSGDATSVGYSITPVSSKNGNPASYSVKLNANKGTTEVVGYPSVQCLLYSALPSTLTSTLSITPPASSTGLDYEYAYDIWLTTAADAEAYNWSGDLELMIWNYVNGQVPAGSDKGTLSDGSKVWVAGNNSSGTVSVVLPKNVTTDTVNIASIISQLKSGGYITTADTGILDVEYGIEAPYGGGQTFTVNSLSVME